jgi:hypothetical protein
MPFYATFPIVIFGKYGAFLLPVYIIGLLFMKIYFAFTKNGKKIAKKNFFQYGKFFWIWWELVIGFFWRWIL